MTDLEYRVLSFLESRRPSVHYLEVLNFFLPYGDSLSVSAILSLFLEEGLVETVAPLDVPPDCSVRISPLGVRALLREREHRQALALLRQQRVDQEQHRERQNHRIAEAQAASQREIQKSEHRFQVRLTLLQALLAFLAGALTSNLDRLVPWLLSLFH